MRRQSDQDARNNNGLRQHPASAGGDAGLQPRVGVAAFEIMAGFTSLGDNCEFGLVQRRAGVEKHGLLRFAFSRITPLIEAMRDRFADLDPLQALSIDQPWGDEYISRFGTRGFEQHTFLRSGDIDPARLRQQEAARIPFLRRRLIEDLEAAETVFVRKSNEHTPSEMHDLHRAMRAYGPNTLLWVEAGDARPPGQVEQLADGLLRGHVDRFAPYGDATAISFDSWLAVCAASHRLLCGDLPMPSAPHPPLVIGADSHLSACNATRVTPADDVGGVLASDQVFRHAAGRAGNEMASILAPHAALRPGRTCTASVWVRIPTAWRGRAIVLAPVHGTIVTAQPAILCERERWQCMWVSFVVPDDRPPCFGIWTDAEAGDEFCATRWTVEQSDHPSAYLIDLA